jgi:hypothetical protein
MSYGKSKSRTCAVVAAVVVALSSSVQAQMPGAPVLQNAWASPGMVVALDIGGGAGTLYGGAIGWAPSAGRFQFSGGVGTLSPKGGGGSRVVYGGRVAMPIMQMMAGKLGIAGFVGIGGGAPKAGDTTGSKSIVPAGVAIGYRQAIGTAGRGVSAFLDPNYQFHTGTKGNKGYFRVGGGVDLGVSSRFGVTLGFESGGNAKPGTVGPSSGLYGIGVSMKFGK